MLQIIANGIISGCFYIPAALGFALIYSTTRTFHFAHGAVFTLSGYLFFTFFNLWNYPVILALVITLGFSALLGVVVGKFLYEPLLKQEASQLIRLLSSLGLFIVIINVVSMIYGNDTRVLSPGVQPIYFVGTVTLTRIQIVTLICAFGVVAIITTLLKKTSLGKMIRAMRDDPNLISAVGLDPKRIRSIVLALGSMLAAISAILKGLDVGIEPNSGMAAVLTSAVAAIIGGVAVFRGAVVGALLLGLLQSFAVWKISAHWQDTITFVVLILFLLFRPGGILGAGRRIEEVGA